MLKLTSWTGGALVALTILYNSPGSAAEPKLIYENNFEKAAPGAVPDGLMVLDGAFAVKEEGGNKFLELPGAPLDTFGLLFGPTQGADVSVSARIHGTGKGRRFPTFGLGLNGVAGYKLQVAPGKKMLELCKGDQVLASTPYAWESDSWTMLRLQVRKAGDGWKVEGKAWKQGGAEPGAWAIAYEEKTEPSPGRATLWGSPYSTTPIWYDDLLIRSAAD